MRIETCPFAYYQLFLSKFTKCHFLDHNYIAAFYRSVANGYALNVSVIYMPLNLYYHLNNLFQRYVEAKKSSKVSFPSLLLCRRVGGNHANSTEERKKNKKRKSLRVFQIRM